MTHSHRLYVVLFSVALGEFMPALDGSITAMLLPEISRALHADVATIEWVNSLFMLVVSGVLLVFGRLGDLRGHKDVYLCGYVGFVATSVMCGLAPSAIWLIIFRALQAVTAAMLMANAMAIITALFPPTERGHALGMMSISVYFALSIGGPLGGLLASQFGWRSVFFINLPIGAVGIWLAHRLIPRDRPEGKVPRFDVLGGSLFFCGLFALLLALNQAYAWGWTSAPTLALIAGAVVLFGVFILVERRRPAPMLDLTLFQNRVFSGSVFAAMMNYGCNAAIFFVLPFYLVSGRNLSTAQGGLVLLCLPIVMMCIAPVAGTLSDRLGSRKPTVFGMAVLVIGLLLLSRVAQPIPLWQVALPLSLCGLGFASFISPNNSRLLGAAPSHRRGIATGVLAAARNTGFVLGIGIAGAVYTTVLHRTGPDTVPLAASVSLKTVALLAALAAITSWMEPEVPNERSRSASA